MVETRNNTNPWKGLNFYVEGEVLYGRNKEIESLSHYIANNTQTVLYGKSGIGKSSILNAGIFPIARRQGMVPVGIRLDHGKDSLSYFLQVRHAIERSGVTVRELLPPISADSETLWEYMHRCLFFNANGEQVELLIVLDQFEEIFTLQQDEKRKVEFFDQLASLLNDVTPLYIVNHNSTAKETEITETKEIDSTTGLDLLDLNLDFDTTEETEGEDYLQKVNYHIVFTLREDFLSYLERYTAYIPVMKANRYALLPLNEEQAADIIMLPRKGLVSKEVAELIIQKVTGKQDFHLDGVPEIDVDAAVLSLYLSRLYIKKGDNNQPITEELVSQFSDDIIKDFYEECVSEIPSDVVEKIEDELITYDGRRNNVSRNDLEREGVPSEIIDRLVYDKKLLRQFNYQGDTRVEFMHDILCPVVDQRIDQREQAQQQEEERLRQEAEKRAYMEEEERKRQEIEHKAARARKRNRRRLGWAVGLLAAGVIGTLLYLWGLEWEHSDYYAGFTYRNGWPVGICEVGANGDDSLTVYYRLTRRGCLPEGFMGSTRGHYFRVEVLCKGGKPTTNKLVEEPIVALDETESVDNLAKEFARMQLNTAKWEFTANSNGEMATRTAYDQDSRVLYSMQFFHSAEVNIDGGTTQQATTLWANYIDNEGKSMRVNESRADRLRITTDSLGFFVGYQFYNEQGIPQKNSRGAYGYAYGLTTKGVICSVTPLDEYGVADSNKCLRFTDFDNYERWTKGSDAQGRLARAEYTANRIVFDMPERLDTLVYNEQGRLVFRSLQTYHRHTWRNTYAYNDDGMMTERCSYANDSLTARVFITYFPRTSTVKTIRQHNTKWPFDRFEIHDVDGDTETERHFQGTDEQHLVPCNNSGIPAYHRQTVTTDNSDPEWPVKTILCFAIDSITQQEVPVSKKIITLTTTGLTKRHFIFDNKGERTMSMEYDIEDGRIVGRHVLGICGDTIRCPQWDENHMNYYRMRFVHDFSGNLVAVKAINEFGSDSTVIVAPNGRQRWIRQIVEGRRLLNSIDNDSIGNKSFVSGIATYIEQTRPLPRFAIDYIHIIDTMGTAYQLGLRDGDLVLNPGNPRLKVARCAKGTDGYNTRTFEARLDTLTGIAPLYKVYLTPQEKGLLELLINQ